MYNTRDLLLFITRDKPFFVDRFLSVYYWFLMEWFQFDLDLWGTSMVKISLFLPQYNPMSTLFNMSNRYRTLSFIRVHQDAGSLESKYLYFIYLNNVTKIMYFGVLDLTSVIRGYTTVMSWGNWRVITYAVMFLGIGFDTIGSVIKLRITCNIQ